MTITDDGARHHSCGWRIGRSAVLEFILVRNVMHRVGYERDGENNVVLLETEIESS